MEFTQTIQTSQKMKLLDFLDNYKTPSVPIHIDKEKKKLKVKDFIKGIPSGWNKWDYKKCKEYIGDPKCNALNINLDKSPFVIIDIDCKEVIEEVYKNEGKCWITFSTGQGLPHLWRLKNKDDFNTTKTAWDKYGFIEKEGKQVGKVDLVYKNVFEWIDSDIYFIDKEIPIFNNFPKIDKKIVNKKNTTKKNTKTIIKLEPIAHTAVTEEQKKIIDNIDNKFWSNYNDWLKIIWALHNSFGSVELVDFYCKDKPGYKGIDDVRKYIEDDTKRLLSFGTICHFSMISNKDNFYKIRSQFNNKFISGSDYDLAKLYLDITADNVIKHNDQLYIYQKPFWRVDKKKNIIKKHLRKTLDDFILFKIDYHTNEIRNLPVEEGKDIQEKIKGLWKVRQSVNSCSKKKSILEELETELEEEDYEIDRTNPNYFCFANKCFDLETGLEIEIKKEDFISMNTGYNYVKPTDEEIQKIKGIIVDIMPDEELRKCFMSILYQSLRGIQTDKFILFNGDGCNGKGWIVEFLEKLMGNYFYRGNKDILLSAIKKGANPELASMDKKRLVVFSEPEEDEKINGSTLKYITDTPSLEARGLYEDLRTIFLHLTPILECNERPAIKGRVDNAIKRRVVDLHFKRTFTEDKQLVEDNPIKYKLRNKELKSKDFIDDHVCALFHIILDSQQTIYIPKIVAERSEDYLNDNDELYNWFNDRFEITDNKNDIIESKKIVKILKNSGFYCNLSKEEKRSGWTNSKLWSKLASHPTLSKYFFERKQVKGKPMRNIFVCVKEKEDEDDD